MKNKNLSVIVPIYNEEKNIDNVIPKLIQFCDNNNFELIIVEDGSLDKTPIILKKYEDKARILKHKVNKGYGSAIKTGIVNSTCKYAITFDADGQHYLNDITLLYKEIIKLDADMIIGQRSKEIGGFYKKTGKFIIKFIASNLMDLPIKDLNSGMKIFNIELAKHYLNILPDNFSFSDIITLLFINEKHLVKEKKINIKNRDFGKSKVTINTAFQTIFEIFNIIVLFNPMKIFLSIAIFLFTIGIIWGLPIIISGKGVSVGSSLLLISAMLSFLLGLIAEQLSAIRKNLYNDGSY